MHLSGCLNSTYLGCCTAAWNRQSPQVLVAKNPVQSRKPRGLSRPPSLDQGHIKIVLQSMVHVCPLSFKSKN